MREVDKDLPNAERIWELPDPSVNIIKASIFCDDGCRYGQRLRITARTWSALYFCAFGQRVDRCHAARCVEGLGHRTAFAEHYGIGRDEVMAFGDSMNDYEIVRFVGTGCAMENARPRLRRWPIAWWVVTATTPSSRSSVACWRVSLIRQLGTFLFCRQRGQSLRFCEECPQRLGEGGHDGAGDAIVVVVVFGDGVGGIAVLGLGVDRMPCRGPLPAAWECR